MMTMMMMMQMPRATMLPSGDMGDAVHVAAVSHAFSQALGYDVSFHLYAPFVCVPSAAAAAAQIRSGVVLSEPVQHFLKRPLTKTQKAMYAAAGLTGPDPCIE